MLSSISSRTSGASAARSVRPVTVKRNIVAHADEFVGAGLDEHEAAGECHQPQQDRAQRFRGEPRTRDCRAIGRGEDGH